MRIAAGTVCPKWTVNNPAFAYLALNAGRAPQAVIADVANLLDRRKQRLITTIAPCRSQCSRAPRRGAGALEHIKRHIHRIATDRLAVLVPFKQQIQPLVGFGLVTVSRHPAQPRHRGRGLSPGQNVPGEGGTDRVTHKPKLLRRSRGARQFGSPGGAPSRLTFQFTFPAIKPLTSSSHPSRDMDSACGSAWRSAGRGCGGAGCGCGGPFRLNAAKMLARVGSAGA